MEKSICVLLHILTHSMRYVNDFFQIAYLILKETAEDETKRISKRLLETIKERGFQESIEVASKNQFKLPVSDIDKFPKAVAGYLQKLKKTSTSFNGKTGRKVSLRKC